jgi:3',5'-cyclic AMP phosphodiesterase CpdA
MGGQVNQGMIDLQYRLAHLSDPHLGPLPSGAIWRDFALKRLIGGTSWYLKRRRMHRMAIADAVRSDVSSLKADHVAVTGDLVNIAAAGEFPAAATWLAGFGTAHDVSYVPGNHDCYVPLPYKNGLAHFEAYTEGDMKIGPPLLHQGGTMFFPFVRLRRNIALIGLSSALPQALHRASGQLGVEQLNVLPGMLDDLRGKGYCRVVMIHHPPLKRLARPRRGLNDVLELEHILSAHGAELVLHGHNHKRSLEYIEGPTGPVPVWGAPSASMQPSNHHEAAGWTMFLIERNKGNWNICAEERNWNGRQNAFAAGRSLTVSRS